MRLEGRTDKDNKLISVERIAVSDDEVKQLCDAGFPIAVVDASQAPKSTNTGSRQGLRVNGGDTRVSQPAPQDGQKTVVEPVTELPSGFTITRSWNLWQGWGTYGSFWVPAALPYGHTY